MIEPSREKVNLERIEPISTAVKSKINVYWMSARFDSISGRIPGTGFYAI